MRRSEPFKGRVKLVKFRSGFRKLARAMRRGMLDPEWERTIKQAETIGKARLEKQR